MIGGPLFIVPLICIPVILILILAVQPLLVRNSAAVSASAQSRQSLLVEVLGGLDALRVNGAFCSDEKEVPDAIKIFIPKHPIRQKTMHKLMETRLPLSNKYPKLRLLFMGSTSLLIKSLQWGLSLPRLSYLVAPLDHLQRSAKHLGAQNAAYVARGNLKRFLSAARMQSDGTGSAIKNTNDGAVEVSSATMRLSEMGRPLFNGLNLSIKKGEKIAIVGRTGSGKTSLIKLIVGLLAPEAGSVMINGSDIRQYPRADLFRDIGTVFQEPWLFTGSLRD